MTYSFKKHRTFLPYIEKDETEKEVYVQRLKEACDTLEKQNYLNGKIDLWRLIYLEIKNLKG